MDFPQAVLSEFFSGRVCFRLIYVRDAGSKEEQAYQCARSLQTRAKNEITYQERAPPGGQLLVSGGYPRSI